MCRPPQDDKVAKHWGTWGMWIWQPPYHRIWRVVAGECCATVPMRLTHLRVLVYLAPVHSCVTATGAWPSTPGSMSLIHTNFRATVYSAQQHLGRPATSLPFIVLHPLHHFPQTYYNTVFCAVLISSFEQFTWAQSIWSWGNELWALSGMCKKCSVINSFLRSEQDL